jgi:branched-chain amino acid transport system permease protein
VESIIQIIANGFVIGALYALVAMGFALVLGVMKYVNIAQGTCIMLGGYVSFWLFYLWGIDPYISIPAVVLVMFIMGVLLYKILFSRLLSLPLGLRLNNSMLVSFGVVWILENLTTWIWTSDVRSVTTSYTGEVYHLFGMKLGITGLAGLGLAVVFVIALHLLLTRTYFGKAVRAATQDAEAASLSGINVHRTFLISCGIGVALAGIAGVVIVSSYSITPNGGLSWLLMAMVVVVLAGEGNINGVLPAGFLLGIIEAVSVFVTGASYREVISLLVFILVLMFKPEGLFSKSTKGAKVGASPV